MGYKGKILIVGGGISGIESALQLSSLGYGVYLVEKSDRLGGMIPNLHRIYPTCACCKIDPRSILLEQDPNVKVFLNTYIDSISGKAGNFDVKLKTPEGDVNLNVAGILLAGGIDIFDPSIYENYFYSHPNVLTSVEYEQLQKPLGPNRGIIKRPSDAKIPERIAWLQCVGSRDINRCDAPYCSSVCCMYALKEAINTKEANPEIDTTIFYMDMRAHGKGFEEYMNNAIDKGIRLVRCRIHTIEPQGDDILIKFVDDSGEPFIEKFDLVVLSVGLRASKDTVEIAKKLGVELNENGFIKTEGLNPGKTNVPGVFACGAILEPQDIGQVISQAGSALDLILNEIEPDPFEPPKEYPEIRDVSEEDPRIAFAYFVCPELSNEVRRMVEEVAGKERRIVKVQEVKGDLREEIVSLIKETDANRLIFASCRPALHKEIIQDALMLSGLNPYLYETIDLSSINRKEQIEDRIRFALVKATVDAPVSVTKVPVSKHALVVGGGITGLEAALSLSEKGYPVTLIEKEDTLGGHALFIKETWQGEDVSSYVKELISRLESRDNVNIMKNAEVRKSVGTAGNFLTTVVQDGREIEIRHGVAIIATGGEASSTEEYLYGKNERVLLWSELSKKLMDDPDYPKSIDTAVFIQCVGSRDSSHPYCSNICCSFSIKTAIEMKEKNPDMDIYILNRDIRTPGFKELLYRKAREKGVIFIRYELERKPVVRETSDRKLEVIVFDPILQKDILIRADLLSLQTAIEPVSNKEISEVFGIEVNKDGFFAESPEKLKPVESTKEGIFIAGVSNYPKDISECISQARAAASKAVSILKREYVLRGGAVAEVDPGKCAVCCTCVRTCPFGIPRIDHERGAAFIDPLLCRGCGICVSECPGKAIKMTYYSDQMLVQAPAILLKKQIA